jgi:pyruvate-formate lyase-activating enzyme
MCQKGSESFSAAAPGTVATERTVTADALAVIGEAEPGYRKLLGLTESQPGWRSPADFCAEILARALAARSFLATARRRAFFAEAGRLRGDCRLTPVLAALDHKARGERAAAFAFAKRALALNQDDLFAQQLWLEVHPEPPARYPLAGRFCEHPFERLETQSRGRVLFCCPAWLPVPVGNLANGSPEALWNSVAAQDIRRSILDGSFRYCSRIHCPRLTEENLPRVDEIADPSYRATIASRQTALPYPPRRMWLSHDRSCNLSCPSCRTSLIAARSAEVERLNEMAERVLLPLIAGTPRVALTGSGDPFASRHFRWLIRQLTSGRFPGLRIDLQSNGLLLKESWRELGLEGYAHTLLVSIDAAEAATYAVVRRGGTFTRLIENLEFAAELRRGRKLRRVRLDFVVQALNYREMPDAARLMRSFGFDGVKFQMLRSWNTYSPDEYARHDVGTPGHPEFQRFLAVLDDPALRGPDVEFYGFHSVSTARLRGVRSAEAQPAS